MTTLLDSQKVSELVESPSFVAIKVESGKEEYTQFARICELWFLNRKGHVIDKFCFFQDQLVPVPSIFFIKNGVPIKIVTSTIKTEGELLEAINSVKSNESTRFQEAESSASIASSEPIVTEPGTEETVSNLPKKVHFTPPPVEVESSKTSESQQEKVDKIKKAMKLIEEKRTEKVLEEKRNEKEKEIQRRKEGQANQDLKKWQEDQELKQIKDEQIREKNEAKAARQRVLEQIEQDKKERAQRFGTQTSPTEQKSSPVTPPAPTSPVNSNTARIQFKKPGGESEVVTFDSEMLFADLHLFVKNDILHGSLKDFILATSFPRREFSEENFKQTLAELNLTPSAVLVIIAGKKKTSSSGPSSVLPTQTDGSFVNMLSAIFMGMMTPIMALVGYLKVFITRTPTTETESANDAGKRKRNEELLMANDA